MTTTTTAVDNTLKATIPPWKQPRLLMALLVALLVVLPFALNLPMYLDDQLRAVKGVSKWSGDGRPVASLVWQLITLNAPRLSLASPLGLLICVPAFLGSGLLLCRTLRHRQVWGPAVVVGLLFACPYFLENLSFSFDAPLMVLAVMANLAAATVLAERPRGWSTAWVLAAAVVLVVVALSLYQAANPAFWLPVGFAVLAVAPRRWLLLLQGVACQVLAVVLYRSLVLAPIELGGYAEKRGTLPEGSELLSVVGSNVQSYGALLKAHWWNTPSGDVFLVFLAVTALVVCCSGGPSMDHDVVAHAVAGVFLRNAAFARRTGVGPSNVYRCGRECGLFGLAGHTRWLQPCIDKRGASCTSGVGLGGHCRGPMDLSARALCLCECPKGSATRESVCRHQSHAHLERSGCESALVDRACR
jgi:hypothetical protein